MSYDTYRPEWDPFFSESWGLKVENPRINWGDRSADPKSDRRVNLQIPGASVSKGEVPKEKA